MILMTELNTTQFGITALSMMALSINIFSIMPVDITTIRIAKCSAY